MKITQINPGLLPIPPNGWGAVEKIIWAYKLGMEKMGHEVNIKYINEITDDDAKNSVIHVHMWNHALELRDKGIPYVYTLHDHHAYVYGNDSSVYTDNFEALKSAELAIVPAEYLVDYFRGVPIYIPHGVDTTEFNDDGRSLYDGSGLENLKLLCVGNNGMAGNPQFDRKGFLYAIQSAKELGCQLTILGPRNYNEDWIKLNNHEPGMDYKNIRYVFDADDEALKRAYKEHHILCHGTHIEAGHPPLTVLEAAASGMPVIGTRVGNLNTIVYVVDRDTKQFVRGIHGITDNVLDYKMLSTNVRLESLYYDWSNICEKLVTYYELMRNDSVDMKNQMKRIYETTSKITARPIKKQKDEHIGFNIHFVDGAFVEIFGESNNTFKVSFIDKNQNKTIWEPELNCNNWVKSNLKYFVDWRIEIHKKNSEDEWTLIHEHDYDASDKRVFVVFESSALGDTLAWIPYVEEFRKKHKCDMYVSTFHNNFLRKFYPNFNFIKPGSEVTNLYALYGIGWFYKEENGGHYVDFDKHPHQFRLQPLQQTSSDILGLEYTEIRPPLKYKTASEQKTPTVVFGIQSTAQSKYWNNPNGWQELHNWFKDCGWDVIVLAKEDDGFMGNYAPKGSRYRVTKSLDGAVRLLSRANMFVGIGSGLSWLSWSMNIPTVLISGFSENYTEFQETDIVKRVINENVCHGCFNKTWFNPGDWNWCPEWKGNERMFECTKEISTSAVIDKIKELGVWKEFN